MSAAPSQPAPAIDLTAPATAQAALRTFFRIAERWQLSAGEQTQLLGIGKSTLYDWRAGKVKRGLEPAVLERLSYVFGIFAALQILFREPERADAWLRKPNSAPLFGGKSALDRMLAGNVADLFVVRQYLDAQRGGWA
ncbi:MAG TPA: MbcA/ParS/Xre antitoxin family protein [Polyangiaceae bacterium]